MRKFRSVLPGNETLGPVVSVVHPREILLELLVRKIRHDLLLMAIGVVIFVVTAFWALFAAYHPALLGAGIVASLLGLVFWLLRKRQTVEEESTPRKSTKAHDLEMTKLVLEQRGYTITRVAMREEIGVISPGKQTFSFSTETEFMEWATDEARAGAA